MDDFKKLEPSKYRQSKRPEDNWNSIEIKKIDGKYDILVQRGSASFFYLI